MASRSPVSPAARRLSGLLAAGKRAEASREILDAVAAADGVLSVAAGVLSITRRQLTRYVAALDLGPVLDRRWPDRGHGRDTPKERQRNRVVTKKRETRLTHG